MEAPEPEDPPGLYAWISPQSSATTRKAGLRGCAIDRVQVRARVLGLDTSKRGARATRAKGKFKLYGSPGDQEGLLGGWLVSTNEGGIRGIYTTGGQRKANLYYTDP